MLHKVSIGLSCKFWVENLYRQIVKHFVPFRSQDLNTQIIIYLSLCQCTACNIRIALHELWNILRTITSRTVRHFPALFALPFCYYFVFVGDIGRYNLNWNNENCNSSTFFSCALPHNSLDWWSFRAEVSICLCSHSGNQNNNLAAHCISLRGIINKM